MFNQIKKKNVKLINSIIYLQEKNEEISLFIPMKLQTKCE